MHEALQMRSIATAVLCAAALSSSQALAEEGPGTDRTANPIAQHLQAMSRAQPPRNVTTLGNVRFVLGNEVWQPGQQFKAGRDWLALACDAKGCVLEPAILSVKQEFWQGHYDDKPTFGQRLSFRRNSGAGGPVLVWFHVAAAPAWLKPGTVPTYYSPQHPLKQPIGRGSLEVTIDLPNGENAILVPMLLTAELMHQLMPGNSGDESSYLLQLRVQGRRQLLLGSLGACSYTFHPRKYLQWAGDLDRDGKPDFLVSFIDADGPVHLYLSSTAKPGQLVDLAGVYMSAPFGGECDGPGGWE